MGWIGITKNKKGNEFYPAGLIANRLDLRLGYIQAEKKPISYWKGKDVYFHICWKEKWKSVWTKYYEDIAKVAHSFWVEFDADQHLNRLESIDLGTKTPWVIPRLEEVSNKFVWEIPLEYNCFSENVKRIPLRMYDRSMECRIGEDRDIDFLGLVDTGSRNASLTLKLLESLSSEHKVKCIVIGKSTYDLYKDSVSFELIKNTQFDPSSVKVFHDLLDRSKVFIDVSYRLTAGRNIYKALYHGFFALSSNTYGVTKYLFPEFGIEPVYFDLPKVRSTAFKALNSWNVPNVQSKRKQAWTVASIDNFVKELKNYE